MTSESSGRGTGPVLPLFGSPTPGPRIADRPVELRPVDRHVASLAEIAASHGAPIDPHVAIAAGALRGLQAVDEARGCDAASGLSRVSADRILVGEDGTVRVLHFGVPGEAQASAIVRALPYASPEQLLRRDIDVRRDRGRTLRRVPDRGGVARHGTERRRADSRTA